MATFTFTVLPWNQGFDITCTVEDPAGPIEVSVVWEYPNINLEDLLHIKNDLLWKVELIQIDRNENGVYDAQHVDDIQFDHDWDRSVGDEDDDEIAF